MRVADHPRGSPGVAQGSGLADVLGGGSGRGRKFCGEMPLPRQAFASPTYAVIAGAKVNNSDWIRKCPGAMEGLMGRCSPGIDGKL